MKIKFMNMHMDENGIDYYTAWNKKSDRLGYIQYDKKWKEYIWVQEDRIQMALGCLKQIIDKLNELNDAFEVIKEK